jgi:hypothetical protein
MLLPKLPGYSPSFGEQTAKPELISQAKHHISAARTSALASLVNQIEIHVRRELCTRVPPRAR